MTVAAELRVDWFRILADLKRMGWSHYAIEGELGIPRASLRNWANLVSTPLHHSGEKLIAFWCTQTQLPREAVPMIEVHSHLA